MLGRARPETSVEPRGPASAMPHSTPDAPAPFAAMWNGTLALVGFSGPWLVTMSSLGISRLPWGPWGPQPPRSMLGHEGPPEQVRDARDQEDDDDLPEADLIEPAPDGDPSHEGEQHRNAGDDAEREEIRRKQPERGIRNELHDRRDLEDRGERDDVFPGRQPERVKERADHRARDRRRSLHDAAHEPDDRCEDPEVRDGDEAHRLFRAEDRGEDRCGDERKAHGRRAFCEAGDRKAGDQGQELERTQSFSPTRDLQST